MQLVRDVSQQVAAQLFGGLFVTATAYGARTVSRRLGLERLDLARARRGLARRGLARILRGRS